MRPLLILLLVFPLVLGATTIPLAQKSEHVPAARIPTFFFDLAKYNQLDFSSSVHITFSGFFLPNGEILSINAKKFSITDNETQFITHGSDGEKKFIPQTITFFRGTVEGKNSSYVYFSLSENSMRGYIEVDGIRYLIMPVDGGALHALYPEQEAEHPAQPFQCMADDEAPGYSIEGGEQIQSTGQPLRVKLAVDVDYETYTHFSSDPAIAANYVLDLFGACSAIYMRDINVEYHISFLRVWTTSNDPYTQGSLQPALIEFQNYWSQNEEEVDRSLAHLVSKKTSRSAHF